MNRCYQIIKLFLFVSIWISCRQKNLETIAGIDVIDIVNNLGQYQEIKASTYVSDFEYIPLETNENCLVGYVRNILINSSRIFVAGSNFCYVFNNNGRFISKIGSVGQGPGEYQFITGLSIDEKNQSVYLETTRSILEYSYDGVFQRIINKPQNMNEEYVQESTFVCDKLFIGHFPNRGKEMYNFCLFNDAGQVIKTFDNYEQFERNGNWVSFSDQSMKPFKVEQHLYVKENANDTLFCLNEENELVPKYVFNLGKYTLPKHLREERTNISSQSSSSQYKDVLVIPDDNYPMVGAADYIFFSVKTFSENIIPLPKGNVQTLNVFGQNYDVNVSLPLGIYHILEKKIFFLETDPISNMLGLVNDLDGGLSFWPKYYTSENELIGIWQAYEMKALLTEAYFAAHEIKKPQAHQKLKELLKNLDEEDNPVVVIAKLK